MSLTDRFNDNNLVFILGMDRDSARRQMRVSVALVAAMALAAFVLGVALPINVPHSDNGQPVVASDSHFSGRLVTYNPP
jgi:hypothetical protein